MKKSSNNHLDSDRNFDDLAHKFQRKVYGGLKGEIRLTVIKTDLNEILPDLFSQDTKSEFNILDAGCGHAPFSFQLAEQGHALTLCDISEKMLQTASSKATQKNLSVQLFNCPLQNLTEKDPLRYDLILCHAVLEWIKDPVPFLQALNMLLKPDGILSLTFYNLNGMIFKNLLRTNYKKILKKEFNGWPGSLTPAFPLLPEQVKQWLFDQDFELLSHSGIRVFHDYILNLDDQKKKPDTVLDLELEFRKTPPFRDMGRYQHMIARKIMGGK